MKIFYSVAFFCVTLFLVSCSNSKEKYIDDYSNFIEEVSEKSASYSGEQWRKADSINDMYSSDYYTHNETLNPNLYPYFRVFIYENWKKEGSSTLSTDFNSALGFS